MSAPPPAVPVPASATAQTKIDAETAAGPAAAAALAPAAIAAAPAASAAASVCPTAASSGLPSEPQRPCGCPAVLGPLETVHGPVYVCVYVCVWVCVCVFA